jgi:hypothetical protein
VRRTIAIVGVALLVLGACSSKKSPEPTPDDASSSGDQTLSFYDAAPPWPLDGQQADRMRAAGVPLLRAEGSLVHYHAHLDVFYDGRRVTVPADVGIDREVGVISPLHTHSASGVMHVEANEEVDFTLGQFLTEWGVKSSDGCVADKCGDEVAVFINGSIQDDAAADVVIKPHSEMALVLGTAPADIPSTYNCKAENPGDIPCSD